MKFLIAVMMLCCAFSYSQTLDSGSLIVVHRATDVTDLNSTVSPNTASLAFVNNDTSLYVFNGASWVRIIDNAPTITNELYFEDNNFIYVSVLVDGTSWMISRYDRSDLNTEASASGTGAQPDTLGEVQVQAYM